MTAKFYVYREGVREDLITGEQISRDGWVGPIDDKEQAEREADAWRRAGWAAAVHPGTAETVGRVSAWQDARIDGWRDSTDSSQRDRWRQREEQRRTNRLYGTEGKVAER